MNDILIGSIFLTALILILSFIVIFARSKFIPSRRVFLTINNDKKIRTISGQKLLTALQDADIQVPSACAGAGTCGLCAVKIKSGLDDILPIEAARFSKSELRDGAHLACQINLRDNLELEIPSQFLQAENFSCNIISTRWLTPLIKEVILKLPDDLKIDIGAGSFIQISAPEYELSFNEIEVPQKFDDTWQSLRKLNVVNSEDTIRAYSVSNRQVDNEQNLVVLNIRIALPPPSILDAQPGIVSSWLCALKNNDIVKVSGPFHTFQVEPSDREMVFIGGGVGMAPLRSMIYEQLEDKKTKRKMSFWYGARSHTELFYTEELDSLADKHSNFEWTAALSDPADNTPWQGDRGFVHSVVWDRYLKDHPNPEECEFYLCGPPLMIRAVYAMLEDLGVEQDQIFNDDFGV